MGIEFRILGPLEVLKDERRIPLGTRMQRALLAALLVRANEVAPTESLIESLWPEQPPPTALKTLRAYISRLRRALDADGTQRLRTVGSGYLLEVDPEEFDRDRFERLVAEARAPRASGAGAEAAALLTEALGLWRGPVLADLAYETFAQAEIARLDELRLLALEERIEASLELGRHTEIVGEVRSLASEHPFRERLWGALMLALYRSGRQAEALEVYREARGLLVDELGIEPGPVLRDIEAAILRQDPTLQMPARDPTAVPAEAPTGTPTEMPDLTRSPAEVRKTVTVVFCDVVGSTTLGEQHDPETLREMMARYFQTAAETFRSHGGTVEKFIGDAVMAAFGIPHLHEDDALRAVRAAWELSQRMPQLNEELERTWGARLEIRTGINTGEVVAGGDASDQHLLTGDPVNTAARLQQAAEPGEILIGEPTYRLVAGAVRAEPLNPLPLRGKGGLVSAYRVEAVTAGVPGSARRLDAPLVGRRGELAQLRGAFDRSAREQVGFLFTVIGPPGIGKTRLTKQFVDGLLGEAKVVTGRCLPYGEGITYWPIRQVLDDAFAGDPLDGIARALHGDADADGVIAAISSALGQPRGSSTTEEVVWAFRRVLEALAREGSVLVVLEDIHWGEPTFLDLIDRIADLSSDSPVMLLCLARAELLKARPTWGGGKLNAMTILLDPLSDEESALLLKRLSADLDDRRIEQILRAAEGNPLFIEQLFAVAVEIGPEQELEVPKTIEALIAARVDHLEPDERAVLQCAAIVGRDFWLEAVADLLPDEATQSVKSRLEALVHRQFVRHERRSGAGEAKLSFRHALIQATVYEAIPKRRRADLHERLSQWLQQRFATRTSDVEEILAYHLERAHRCRRELGMMDDRTWQLAAMAVKGLAACGRRAVERGDAAAATSLLTRAIALVDECDGRVLTEASDTRAWMLLDRGRAFGRLGDLDSGRRDLELALQEARRTSDRLLAMRAMNELGFLLAGAADYRAAVPLLEGSLTLAHDLSETTAEVLALARLSIVDTNRLRLDLSIDRARGALELAEKQPDDRSIALALDALLVASVLIGDMAEVGRIAPRLLEIHRRQGDRWYQQFAVYQGAWAPLAAARWDEAAERIEEAWAINREIGDRSNEALYPSTLGWIDRASGNYGQSLERGRRAVDLATGAGHVEFVAFATGLLGWTLEEVGLSEEATEALARSLTSAEAAGAHIELVRAIGHLSLARCRRGSEHKAQELLRRGDALLGEVTAPPGRAYLQGADGAIALAHAHLQVGERDHALALLSGVLPAATRAGWVEMSAMASLAIGIADREDGTAQLERALETADAAGLPGVSWRARAALAGRVGRSEAERHIELAREAVSVLAGTIEDVAIRDASEAAAAEEMERLIEEG